MLPVTLWLQGERPRLCPATVRGGPRGVWNPAPPSPSPCSPSPPKFPGSLCQGDISISPVSMTTQRQVSARRMREPARATWGAAAHRAPTLRPHPRAGGATLWGDPQDAGGPAVHGGGDCRSMGCGTPMLCGVSVVWEMPTLWRICGVEGPAGHGGPSVHGGGCRVWGAHGM